MRTSGRYTNFDDRSGVADLFAVADTGLNARRMIRYNANTLNSPFKAGLTGTIDSGLAIITMGSSGNYGTILCIPEGGLFATPCICKKTTTWGNWISASKADFNPEYANDLNTIPSGFDFLRYNSYTLNSPYKQGLTSGFVAGGVLSFGYGEYANQLAMPAGVDVTFLCVRAKTLGKWSNWKVLSIK